MITFHYSAQLSIESVACRAHGFGFIAAAQALTPFTERDSPVGLWTAGCNAGIITHPFRFKSSICRAATTIASPGCASRHARPSGTATAADGASATQQWLFEATPQRSSHHCLTGRTSKAHFQRGIGTPSRWHPRLQIGASRVTSRCARGVSNSCCPSAPSTMRTARRRA